MPPRTNALPEPGDAVAWARWLLDQDRLATARFPDLAVRKQARVLASPHALLRGTAPLFYALLKARGEPLPFAARGTVIGDMHLENVGVYRCDGAGSPLGFDLNDFDDAGPGPLAVDPLRLAVSSLLAGRSFGASPHTSLATLEAALTVYARVLGGKRAAAAPHLPAAVEALLARAARRTKRKAIEQRTELVQGERRFVRGPRYADLPEAVAAQAPRLLEHWLAALGPRRPAHASHLRVIDAARRIAGTGSLGVWRIALLTRDDQRELRMIELKEARAPSLCWLSGRTSREAPAARVVSAASRLVAHPPRRLAALPTLRLEGEPVSLVGRALAPQEDKLELNPELESQAGALLALVFHLVARAQRRALGKPVALRDRQLAVLVDQALWLAGQFEALALAHARLTQASGALSTAGK